MSVADFKRIKAGQHFGEGHPGEDFRQSEMAILQQLRVVSGLPTSQNTKSQMLLAKLRCSDSSEVKRVVGIIDKHNAGLEQEALLIEDST